PVVETFIDILQTRQKAKGLLQNGLIPIELNKEGRMKGAKRKAPGALLTKIFIFLAVKNSLKNRFVLFNFGQAPLAFCIGQAFIGPNPFAVALKIILHGLLIGFPKIKRPD